MPHKELNLAPGARIVVRDAEWLVRKVDNTFSDGQILHVTGISEVVREKEAIFLTEIDHNKEFNTRIEVLAPEDTKLVQDESSAYRSSILYMESLLRQKAPTDEKLYIGHKAAMDAVPYQLDPARQALKQSRQRILIADAVGLGKTLEAGILMSELIKRGKGKRILVLAVKSMLTQFQKEMWARFSIPLTRLDSTGLQRIRANIPTNHNPFNYYDKAIISIDTLKNDQEYRVYIEQAYWDIIVIDEAHNVAERGHGQTLRARLAKLLADKSDTLIMLSATPHDGKAKSFASLMNMLNPTAIANPEKYTSDEIKGLFIRRFKKDIKAQVIDAFMEREIIKKTFKASPAEEEGFDTFSNMKFHTLDNKRSGGMLFKIGLEKSLFSSPAACINSIDNRIKKLLKNNFSDKQENNFSVNQTNISSNNQAKNSSDTQANNLSENVVGNYENEWALKEVVKEVKKTDWQRDIAALSELSDKLRGLSLEDYTKYQKLLELIKNKKKGWGWTGRDTNDRLVIFTERIETMKFLAENLKRDLKLKDKAVEMLSGSDAALSDVKVQEIVEHFGQEGSPIRLLIATDVASEGINLHYLCHRLIHFDIPWSLMVFQQRNGRIDRYGQTEKPLIAYLVTESENEKIKGDTRILELLIQKDQQVVENIGDEASIYGVYDHVAEEEITARAFEESMSTDEFERNILTPENRGKGSNVDSDKNSTDGPDLFELLLMGAVDENNYDDFDDANTGLKDGKISAGSKVVKAGEDGAVGAVGDTGDKEPTSKIPSLYKSDYDYCRAAFNQIKKQLGLQIDFYEKEGRIDFSMPDELKQRFKYLPREIRPQDNRLILSDNKIKIMDEIKRCRQDESAWPQIHYLWPLNPVVQWLNDKVTANFKRHEAPVIRLKGALKENETVFIISGRIPNRKGQALVHEWLGVKFEDTEFTGIENFTDTVERTGLSIREFPNTGEAIDIEELKLMLKPAVKEARKFLSIKRKDFEDYINPKLNMEKKELDRLKMRQFEQMELKFESSKRAQSVIDSLKQKESAKIEDKFGMFRHWVQDTMTSEDNPFIQVISVLRG